MRGRLLKMLMVALVLVPVGLTAYLANNLYHRKGVPEALENLTSQLFRSKEEERKAELRATELERKTGELQTAYDSLVADLKGEVDSKEIRVRQFREMLEINFVDKILFGSGSADITPHGREVLLKVAAVLGKVKDKSIYVVGHTDAQPIHSALYPSNWELSTARSSSVIRFLSETGGLTPERFTAMGRSFYQPVASNATAEGRQENRRVDIIVADVPLLAGETGSESMRGTVTGRPPVARDLTREPEPVRETAPKPSEIPPATPVEPATPSVPAGPSSAPQPAPAAGPDASPAPAPAAQPATPPAAQPAEQPATPAEQPATPAEQPATPAASDAPAPAGAPATPSPTGPTGLPAPELPPDLPDRPGQ
uniref:Flagellar motor protein n=1 Tax=Desulfovibrio sp. U5L TaxID=596152 RepID=I2Q7C8_9BACT